ncbi:MAG: hypothetical protein ACTHMY_03460 [Solirubrobacteraceae bacterium]
MPRWTDLSPEEQEQMRQQVLAEMAAEGKGELTRADIEKMTAEEIVTRKKDIDHFLRTYDGRGPVPVEGEEDEEGKPELTPIQKYRAELAAMPDQEEARRRANEDWNSGKLQKLIRGEGA